VIVFNQVVDRLGGAIDCIDIHLRQAASG
jgi:hypothetical protein